MSSSLFLSREGAMVLQAVEKLKNMTHSAACLFQVSISLVQQKDDGIFHSNMGLVCELQGVQCWLKRLHEGASGRASPMTSLHVMSKPLVCCHCVC